MTRHPRSGVDWDVRFMDLCLHIADWSKDPNTKYGAIIVGDRKRVVSVGYNGFPRGLDDSKVARYTKPGKYLWVEHAERNAIYNAGEPVVGYTLYVGGPSRGFPCADCARAIIQSGLVRVVAEPRFPSHEEKSHWRESHEVAKEMLEEAGVGVFIV